MPGTAAEHGSLHRGVRRSVLLVALAVAVVVASVAITASVLLRPAGATEAARQSVGVESPEGASTSRWNITARAVLISMNGRTAIQAHLIRKSADASTPALTGNFDGSGGGEAELITCTATARTWTVSAGGSQAVHMSCDQYVEPFAVHRLKYVHIDVKQ